MTLEPPIPEDGRCVQCGKPITTVTRYGDADAFCSSRCCRAWYGTSLDVDMKQHASITDE